MKSHKVSFIVRSFIIVIAVILVLTVVLGCQKEVKPTGTITLYTSVPMAIIEELKQEFEAENPGVHLEIYRKGTSAVVEKINEEIAGLECKMKIKAAGYLLCLPGWGETEPEDSSESGQAPKIYRNNPCPCGSGRKYKDCCKRIEQYADNAL